MTPAAVYRIFLGCAGAGLWRPQTPLEEGLRWTVEWSRLRG